MDWVLFDYGEVITRPPPAEVGELMAAEFGVPAARFWPAYWHDRERYDRGAVDAAGFWRSVAGQLGTTAPADLNRLVTLDLRAWFDLNPGTLALLDELAGHTPLAMLSNAPLELAAQVDAAPWANLFRHRFFSARLGRTKPDPRIFEQVCELLGAQPADVLFVDDRQDNVTAAAKIGMRAVRFTDVESLRTELRS
jgi:putative hydrolase of the HAD superfamily